MIQSESDFMSYLSEDDKWNNSSLILHGARPGRGRHRDGGEGRGQVVKYIFTFTARHSLKYIYEERESERT